MANGKLMLGPCLDDHPRCVCVVIGVYMRGCMCVGVFVCVCRCVLCVYAYGYDCVCMCDVCPLDNGHCP